MFYLTTRRPGITFVLCLCAGFQANPKDSHFNAAKRILKYLKGTTNDGLWYPNEATLNLKGYSDSDFAGCKLDRKSTSGTCHLLGASFISLNSKKQACVAPSTAEAEYIAAGDCCAQICWLKQQLSDFVLKSQRYLCSVTTLVLLISQEIQCITLQLSILRLGIISLESK